MGRCIKQYDKDYMKMAILKQEETFRQQVHELHRLYRVQKLLMNDMKAELKRQRKPLNTQTVLDKWNSSPHSHQNKRRTQKPLDLELPADNYIVKNAMQESGEESDLELTLATGSGGCRRRKKENSLTSDSAASFSSSSTESGGVKLNGASDWGLFHLPADINLGSYRGERMSKFNGETDQMGDELAKRPPWLFQCLSLNMT